MKKRILFITLLLGGCIVISSCRGHKDCQGRRHTVKTEMGGWL